MTQPDGHGPQRSSGSSALATRLSGGLEVSAVHRTTGQVQSHSVGQSYAVLGRAPQASIRLDDPSVSQCHAYLQLVDGVPYCIDLGSRTGVLWDDGGRGRGWIHPGQTVRIGIFDGLKGFKIGVIAGINPDFFYVVGGFHRLFHELGVDRNRLCVTRDGEEEPRLAP